MCRGAPGQFGRALSCTGSEPDIASRGQDPPALGAPREVSVVVGCLALNASFEPLTMVPMRRALRLVIDGKAEIVEADPDKVVRSERLTMPRPAVIRLTKFIHVPRRC